MFKSSQFGLRFNIINNFELNFDPKTLFDRIFSDNILENLLKSVIWTQTLGFPPSKSKGGGGKGGKVEEGVGGRWKGVFQP